MSITRKTKSNSPLSRGSKTRNTSRDYNRYQPREPYKRPPVKKQELSVPLQNSCLIAEQCQTCAYINQEYMPALQKKYQSDLGILNADITTDQTRVLPVVASPQQLGYRCYMKLAVRPYQRQSDSDIFTSKELYGYRTQDEVPKRFSIGLFKPGTHDVVDMSRCPLHTHALQKLLRDLIKALDQSELTPYIEKEHTGDIRYIAARQCHLTEEILLTFVVTDAKCKNKLRALVNGLKEKRNTIIGAFLNINTSMGNEIFGEESVKFAGADYLRERVCNLDLVISPGAFFQINPWQASNIYSRIEQLIGPAYASDQKAWDLYCGVGAISLIMARLGYQTLGIEENPHAIHCAEINKTKNSLESRLTFLQGKVEEVYHQIPRHYEKPQVLVVNPSRKGLAENVREFLCQNLNPTDFPDLRIIYLSCDMNTLARDLKDFVGAGFRLRQVEAFDMFPQTDKLEWLAILTP